MPSVLSAHAWAVIGLCLLPLLILLPLWLFDADRPPDNATYHESGAPGGEDGDGDGVALAAA